MPLFPGSLKIIFSITDCIFCVGEVSPNIQTIKESCLASSDYFTLYERIPKIFVFEKNLMPKRESIQGKIEFKNIKFIYPSDKNQRPILDDLNIIFEPVGGILLPEKGGAPPELAIITGCEFG